MKLSKQYRKLAKQAGFAFWKNETYGSGKGYIDWASNYDASIVNYTELVIEKVLSEIESYRDEDSYELSSTIDEIVNAVADKLLVVSDNDTQNSL